MRVTWPGAVQFDPFGGTASPVIEALLEGPGSAGPVVLLAAGSAAQRAGWAGRSALALAEAFAARGENVILADLSLERPELHRLVGVGNDEGLTDVFLFGASLQHTAASVPGRTFRLIPASQFTPDAAEVLQHARWSGVFEELAIEKSKLLAYLPIDVPGASAFSDRVGHTVVLADPSDLPDIESALSPDADVICVLMRPGAESAQAEAAAAQPEPEEIAVTEADLAPALSQPALERLDDSEFEKIRIPKDGARDALIADLRKRQRAALMAPPPAMTPLPEEAAAPAAVKPLPRSRAKGVEATEMPLFTLRAPQPKPKRSRAWMTWMLVLIALGAAGAGGWYYWETQYAVRPAPVVRARRPAPPPAAPVIAESPGTKLPYSVAIASYVALNTARDQLGELSKAQNDIMFYIAPVVLQGKTFYRIMAGPVPDSAGATALRDTLIARRVKTISSGWDVVSTPYAFLIGDFGDRGQAEAARNDAEQKTIPAYVLKVMTPGGSTSYRVYSGAFTGPGDADFMRAILKGAGYPDNLVERTGSIS